MIKAIFVFLSQFLSFWKWGQERSDVRTEKRHQSNVAKEFVKNEEDINKLYPTRTSSDSK
jgi:hypothetical protein